MASNLAGMFQQMGQTINQTPQAQGLMDQAGQHMGNFMGQRTGQDPMSFMTQESKELQAANQLKQLDLSTPEGVAQAAQIYQSIGNMEQAMAYGQKAQQMAQAKQTRENAQLDSMQQVVEDEAKSKRLRSLKTQAINMAKRKGDNDAVVALESGAITGADYLKGAANAKKEARNTTTLSDGAMVVDTDTGLVIAENTKSPSSGDAGLSVADKKAIDTAHEQWKINSAMSAEAAALATQVREQAQLKSGAYATVDEWLKGVTGKRDGHSQIRTQYQKLRNFGVVKAMPRGPASDKDVEIFMKGFPPNNAGGEEIARFLEAQANIAQKTANYEEMRADYIATGRRGDFIKDWKRRMDIEARAEFIAETPDWAVEDLQADPARRDEFLDQYGWLPEGY